MVPDSPFTRRRLLGGVVAAAALAGCSATLDERAPTRERPRLEVLVANETDDPIEVTVAAFRREARLSAYTYRLEPGHADESRTVVGLPTEIRVDVEGRGTTRAAYSVPATCESPEIDVWIRPDAVRVSDGCPPP